MKKLNNRGLQEDFYKIVANNLEFEVEGYKSIIVYESREPLSSITYKYKTTRECQHDYEEILKYQQ